MVNVTETERSTRRRKVAKKVSSRETVSSGVKERLKMAFLKRTVSKSDSSKLN